MVSGEDIAAERSRNNNEQEGTTVGRNVLAKSEAAVQERDSTGSEMLAIRRVDRPEIVGAPCGRGSGGGQVSNNRGRVGVGVVGRLPIGDGGNRPCRVGETVGEA
jgi:hypothetical protein